jgi:hypothetical protein
LALEFEITKIGLEAEIKVLEKRHKIKTIGICAASAVATVAAVFFIMKKRQS